MLVFLDVDGTLYSSKLHGVPSSAKEAVDKARRNGHKVFLCTGRNAPSCGLSLNVDVDGFVYSSGSLVVDGGSVVYDAPFIADEVCLIKSLVKEFGLGYSMECAKGSYCDALGTLATTHYFTGRGLNEETLKVARDHFFFEDTDEVEDTCYKFGIYATSMEDFLPIVKKIPDTMFLNVLSSDDDPYVIGELTHRNVSKATGIEAIVKYEGKDLADTIGFGDSSNDIPMLKCCGHSVAMGNGSEKVKEIADFVTKDVDEDGLAFAFEKFGLIE